MKKYSRYAMLGFCLAMPAVFATAGENSKTSKSFTVQKGGNLEISLHAGEIVLKTWNKDEVFVNATGIDEEYLNKVTMEQSGNTITVSYEEEDNSDHIKFTVQLPESFNVDAGTSGGNVTLQGILRGNLKGKTSGGTIEVSAVEGKATLKTSGGNIEVGSVKEDASLTTAGGNIKVGAAKMKLEATTAGGNVNVGEAGGSAVLTTAGGNVELGKASADVTLKTAGGNVELGGGVGMIKTRTAGGNIEIKGAVGTIEGKTAGGDIVADFRPDGKGKSELGTAGGDITVTIPADVKATIEASIKIQHWKSESDDFSIQSDFAGSDIRKDEKQKKIIGKIQLNGGGETITLTTSNGNIIIKKK